ncbi:MFS transporter [Leucobacter sp. M11]|uniref:MFS transporter n=1 Tax=Leucobacter sp. M11 TaxID=2993565 RepID=UPI002D8071FE|nr:MFS transporter [Leucobacter sp. M11]MEB4613425.1 MFS transporter [Leucobacter sp. M11]
MTESAPAPSAPAGPQLSTRDARKIATAAFVGTALEWYDYYIFGTAAALVFNRLFFTELNPNAAVLATFATFGVGFLARPLGAILFGFIGDRYGRRPALIASVVLIGIATGLIGLLPDYTQIHIWAPILLVALRLVQGVAVGGEWSGAMTMAVEHAPVHQRGRFAALVQLGSPVATLVSSGAFALVLLLPPSDFDAWGWRLPFLFAFPLLLVAVAIRVKLEESPVFRGLVATDKRVRTPAFEVFRRAPGRLGVAVLASLLGIGGFYTYNTFVVNYGAQILGVERGVMVNATLIAALGQIVVTLVSGRLAERFGAGRVTAWGGLLTAATAFPVFWLIDTKDPLLITVGVTVGLGSVILAYGVSGALLTELFPAELRYSGVGLGYNIAAATSGFMPLLASTLLFASGNQSWGPALLLVVVALLTALGGVLGQRLRVVDEVPAAALTEREDAR